MNVQRAEEIEKRMEELEVELYELNDNPDREYVAKRTQEIMAESSKLSDEIIESLQDMAKFFGIELDEEDSSNSNENKKEEI